MEILRESLGALCLVFGAVFCVIGGSGLLRLPDVYSRIHGAGVVDTLGAALILIGLMFEPAHWTVQMKLLGVVFFLYVTGSTATHALAQAAHASGVEPWFAPEDPQARSEGEES